MTYDEAVSYYFRKAGRILFVSFISICLAVFFLLILQIAGANQYFYFVTGAFYCLVNNLLWKITQYWRKA
jgi:hypothetical protein